MRTLQSKKNSFIESVTNTFIGYILTVAFSPLVYWTCGLKVNNNQILLITLLFTILSIARNYVIRRWFNKMNDDGKIKWWHIILLAILVSIFFEIPNIVAIIKNS